MVGDEFNIISGPNKSVINIYLTMQQEGPVLGVSVCGIGDVSRSLAELLSHPFFLTVLWFISAAATAHAVCCL